uniref:Uncharacterized protein n=1 Tax=Magnetococcus massalia (strain MO-1) TaxID=451514 RepID=A0A1S7LIG4_MAGMO|nr:protein of unknown function [Candidatus Magnetococcus massalia]
MIGGCAAPYQPAPVVQPLKSDSVITTTADQSNGIIFFGPGGRYCQQPYPDATFNASEAADLNLSLLTYHAAGGTPGQQEKSDLTESETQMEMAGRSPAVLITRELFYRLCETSNNLKLSKEEVLELYKSTLQVIQSGWAAEAQNTKVSIGETLSITDQASETETDSTTLQGNDRAASPPAAAESATQSPYTN